jgi:uncharacterized protein
MSTDTAAPAAIALHAPTVELPAPIPKATTLDPGQHESSLAVWEALGLRVGVWECSPGCFTSVKNNHAEVCQILSGRGSIENADGSTITVEPGVLLILPHGWCGTWTLTEPTRKSYVIIPVS